MYYFASDMHLGLAACGDPHAREKLVVRWLDEAAVDATAIYLMGDVFDYWFEYRNVVPKGFVRMLGKLAELTDLGVEIHFFTGNHDLWVWDYLQNECGVQVHTEPQFVTLAGKRLMLAHGDGLGISSWGFKAMSGLFHNHFARIVYSAVVHPDLNMKFGYWWSGASRKSKNISHNFWGEKEPLVPYSRKVLQSREVDYFIYGHTHCAEQYQLTEHSTAVFLGEWIASPTYAVLDEQGVRLLKFK